jgi:alpha-galactosidase
MDCRRLRLMSPREGEQSVTETVSRDGKQAVAFAFLHSSTQGYPFPRVYLRSLDEEASYKLDVISGKAEDGTPSHATGGYWMHHGIDLALRGDFQAVALRLERE